MIEPSCNLVSHSGNVPQSKCLTNAAENPSYRMVALDLDGTTLQSNHQLSDEQAKYLRDLHNKGFVVCIATGRAAPSVYEHIQKLNFPRSIPVVCSNGARGLLCRTDNTKEELFHNPVPETIVRRAIRLGKQFGYATQYYCEEHIFANHTNDTHYHITGKYTELTGSQVCHVDDDFESLLSQGQLPSKLLIIFEDRHLKDAVHVYKAEFGSEATIVCGTYDWFLEILHPEVTKGHGLQRMCSSLNIPMEECIAIGDGSNDVEFLQMSGLGIAMKNANDLAKKHADEVMEWTNDQNGVMKTLERLESQGLLSFDEP